MAIRALNSIGGFSVGESPVDIIQANGDVTTTNLTANGIVNFTSTSNVSLGAIANLHISGGSSGQVIQTDGSGILSFVTIDSAALNNGTSNIRVLENGNIVFSSNGVANVVTITGTGENVSGYLTVSGNITSGNANLGNFATATYLNTASLSAGNVRTDHLLYANGDPWDLQEASGANNWVQYNTNNNFDASGNFTYNDSIRQLTVLGNAQFNSANLGNLGTANYIDVASNLVTSNLTVNLELQANTANFDGNVVMDKWLSVANTANVGNLRTDHLLYANGQPWDLQEAAGSNTQIQYNDGLNNFGASANFTYNDATQAFYVNGNANITGTTKTYNEQLTSLASTQIVFGNGSSYLVGSANFTYNDATQAFYVNGNANITGNANVGGTLNTANINSGSSSLTINANGSVTTYYANGDVAFPANVSATTFSGNFSGNFSVSAPNTTVLFSDTGAATGSNAFTFNKTSNLVSISGNVDLGLAGENQIVNLSNTALEIRGGWGQNSSTGVNIVAGNYADGNNWGKLAILGNYSGNAVGFSEANAFVFTSPGYGAGNVVRVDVLNTAATNTTTGALQVDGGVGITEDVYIGGNLSVAGNIANANNVSITNNLAGNTANFSGNISSLNANLGNLATANYINVANDLSVTGNIANANNVSITNNLAGNTANFSGNISSLNANLGNLATANYVNVNNNLTVLGNISGNLVVAGSNQEVIFNDGGLANANAGMTFDKVTGLFSITANANVGNLNSGAAIVAVGNISGNNGNFTNLVTATTANVTTVNATGNVNANNVSVTNDVIANNVTANANVVSDNLVAKTGNVNISATGSNNSVVLVPTGTGVVNVSNAAVINVGGPVDAHDAATKEYVDNAVSASLNIHDAVLVETPTALNATYTQGGTTPTVTTISGGNVLTTSTNHGLSVDDMIVFNSTSNGLTAGVAYFVYSVPALNQITLSATYPGPEITTLTNGTGLTLTSRANSGVGATLTNAGANVALSIDNVALSIGNRVLVYNQTNQAENGIYTVTIVGNGSTAWELTRATDNNKYIPNSPSGMSYGDYFFVQDGDAGAGESYVNNTVGVIIIGTTNITFAQFADTQVYTAGTGLALNGTQFSIANTTVTANSYGNGDRVASFTVNSQGQLTAASDVIITANAANLSGTSLNSNIVSSNLTSVGTLGNLSVTGNVTAGNLLGVFANGTSNVAMPVANGNINLSVNGNANVVIVTDTGINVAGTLNATGNANVGNLGTGGLITATGNVSGGNLTTGGQVVATGNVSGGNITTGGVVSATGNVSGGNLTTAGQVVATGNVSGGNITTANSVIGQNVTANSTLFAANANVSGTTITDYLTVNNAITANTANLNGNLAISNANALWGIKTDNLYYSNGQPWDLQEAAGSNTQIQFNSNNNFGASANLTWDSATNVLGVTGTANVTGNVDVSNTVHIGNTGASWGTVTTNSIVANQTISTFQISSTSITGVEFLVKGVDSTGAKYSVATVVAVTDGSTADYTTFATVRIGGSTGTLAVNITSVLGVSNVALQVTPSSSNSTVWTTQYRVI